MSNTKTCTRCTNEKPIEEFYAARRSHCISCERESARERMLQTKNRLRTALRDSKRTAAKFGCHDDLSIDDLIEAFEFFEGHCPYCDKRITTDQRFSIDHIVPLSKQGANTISNIVICHLSCNVRKGNRSVAEIFGAETTALIAEYSAFQRADDELVEKCIDYLHREKEVIR